jgi:hypothetical protein
LIARCLDECGWCDGKSRQRVAGDARVEGSGCNVATTAVTTADEDEDEGQDAQPDKDDDEHDNPLPMVGPPGAVLVVVVRTGTKGLTNRGELRYYETSLRLASCLSFLLWM